MSNRVLAFVAVATIGLTLGGCSSQAATTGGGGDIATVNGEKITREQYDAKLESGPQGKQVFNQLVQGALIDQYAKDSHITVTDAEVSKKEDEIKARYPAGQFDVLLKNQGLTEDDVKHLLTQQLIVSKAVDAQIKVSDADVKSYLAKNHLSLDTPDEVRARHILVTDKKTADTVEEKLKAGGKFEDLAKQYSTDPSTKDKGGELGFFPRGQMVKAFSDAAFSQPLNVVGPPVKSSFGFHIIEVEEKKPATKATMANSGDKIRTQLTQQQEQAQIPQFLAGLRSKANIVILDDHLKDALPPLPPTPAPSVSAAAAASAAATSPAKK